jgi:CRP-like cAMP-binding protein
MNPKDNQLLAVLSDDELAHWQPLLVPVTLLGGQALLESGDTPSYLLFPTTAVVSLSYLTRDGASAEFAVVGNDGFVGMSLIMGGNTMPGRALVQSAGQGYRMAAEVARTAIERGGELLKLLLRYTQSLIVQTAQTAVCNRHHSIDQQLSRRLLMGLDRAQSDELAMTHEAVANLLGVRREGVTAAAQKLQRAGAISYRRGHIAVIDRRLLEALACECYAVVRKEHHRLLPLQAPTPVPTLATPSLAAQILPLRQRMRQLAGPSLPMPRAA